MIKIEVVDERENKFFKRKDINLKLDHNTVGTPSKKELVEKLAEKNNVDQTQVIVDYISTKKGATESVAHVKILDEKPPVKEEPKSEEKKDEAAAEQPKEEPKKEEAEKK